MNIATFYNLPGGGSIHLLNELVNHLKENNLVDIYTTKENNSKIQIDCLEHEQIVINIKPWKSFLLRNIWIITKLPKIHQKIAQEIDKKEYDVVLINHDYFTKSPYILRYLKTKKYYILHEPQREFYEPSKYHAPFIKDKIANIFRFYIKIIDQINCGYANLIIVNSKYSQKVIKNVYKRNSVIMYPGVDEKLYSPNFKLRQLNQLLIIGNYSKIKGHDFIVRSLKSMLGKYKLCVIGSGRTEDRDHFLKLAGEKAKYIEFKKGLTENEMVEEYRKSIVTCIAAYMEPFGLTSIESQSCGTPVVAVGEGGYRETIIDGQTGYLTARQEDDFKNKVLLAIKNHNMLGKQARSNILNNWTIDRTFNTIDRILNQR